MALISGILKCVTTYHFVEQILILEPNNLNTHTIFNSAKDSFKSKTGHDKLIPDIIKHTQLWNFVHK